MLEGNIRALEGNVRALEENINLLFCQGLLNIFPGKNKGNRAM